MTEKPGRNDPCPCGSGKKYKHCCIGKEDNVIPFPGVLGDGDALKKYEEMVERWDPADGPPPSFQESLGRPNLATESLKGLQESIGDRQFSSLKEAEEFVRRYMKSANEAPRADFLGLSPSVMRALLDRPFHDNTNIVTLNTAVPPESFSDVPVLGQCLYLLRRLGESGKGIKATQKGNFPRSLVQDFHEVFLREHGIIDSVPRQEGEVVELETLRFFLADSGLMKKRGGLFTLTKNGEKFCDVSNLAELYFLLFTFMAERHNWLYGTRYPDAMEFVQNSLVFCLYLLKKKAGNFIEGNELAGLYNRAFPVLADSMGPSYGGLFVRSGFCHLFLDRFAWWLGLADKKGGEKAFLSSEFHYRTSGLFSCLFSWKV